MNIHVGSAMLIGTVRPFSRLTGPQPWRRLMRAKCQGVHTPTHSHTPTHPHTHTHREGCMQKSMGRWKPLASRQGHQRVAPCFYGHGLRCLFGLDSPRCPTHPRARLCVCTSPCVYLRARACVCVCVCVIMGRKGDRAGDVTVNLALTSPVEHR